MKPAAWAVARRRRAATTVTEMVVSTALGVLLMMLVATTWATFGRPALEVESRAGSSRKASWPLNPSPATSAATWPIPRAGRGR